MCNEVTEKILIPGFSFSRSLTVIFNQSIRNGEWIAELKRGEWIPVHKKDDKQRDINYRPVSYTHLTLPTSDLV